MSDVEPWGGRGLGPVAGAGSEATKVEQTRAGVEVIASMQAARAFPRDPVAARAAMQRACSDAGLAGRAFYAFPKGKINGKPNIIEGPTVVLMRALAAIWGNLDYGTQQLSRDPVRKQSEGRAFCRDLETNVYKSRTVIIPWVMFAASSVKPIDSARDLDTNDNSVLGRAEREAIEAVLPPAFVAEAITLCRETNDRGDGRPLPDQVADIVGIFGKARPPITPDMLAEWVGRPVAEWTGRDVARLRTLFESMRAGSVTRAEVFPVEPTGPAAGFTAADAGVPAAAERGTAGTVACPACGSTDPAVWLQDASGEPCTDPTGWHEPPVADETGGA